MSNKAINTNASSALASEPVATAWDEGYRAGITDERESEANIGIAGFDAKVEPARNNPYRSAPPAAAQPDEPVTRMSSVAKRKAADLMASGYTVAGYVLERDGCKSAVLWDAAVRWITPTERHRLMHVEGSLIEQPAAARVPLTRDVVVEMLREAGYFGELSQRSADFVNGLRHGERAHGITGEAAGQEWPTE